MNNEKLKKLVFTGLFTALVFISTYAIKIQTPTLGYIHPGDGLVLLAGIILGPLYGGFAAGVGSMLSDLLGGYMLYVPATFIIKAVTAILAYVVFHQLTKIVKSQRKTLHTIVAGCVAELFMVFGYFLFEIGMLVFTTGNTSEGGTIASAALASLSGVPFNLIQGLFGVLLVSVLYPIVHPVLHRITA